MSENQALFAVIVGAVLLVALAVLVSPDDGKPDVELAGTTTPAEPTATALRPDRRARVQHARALRLKATHNASEAPPADDALERRDDDAPEAEPTP